MMMVQKERVGRVLLEITKQVLLMARGPAPMGEGNWREDHLSACVRAHGKNDMKNLE